MFDFLLTKKIPDPPCRPNEPNEAEQMSYTEKIAKYESNKRITEIINNFKIVGWTLSLIIGTFLVSFITSDDFKILVWERLFPPQQRVESMRAYLSKEENAETKREFLDALVDAQFQNSILTEKLANNIYKDVGLKQFPKIGKTDLFVALGKAKKEDLAIAFDTEFIEFLETDYPAFVVKKFLRAKQVGGPQLEAAIVEAGSIPEPVNIKTFGSEFYGRLTSCETYLKKNEPQVVVAFPWDVWQEWKTKDKKGDENKARYIHLQCQVPGFPSIYLAIKTSSGAEVSGVRLVGVSLAEDQAKYKIRMANRITSEAILHMAVNDRPIELRITEFVAMQLELPAGMVKTSGSFVISQAGKTTREMIFD